MPATEFTPSVVPPTVIHGGMGVQVSSWHLAQQVAREGQLGVVSGTALDLVLSRRLQDGDPGGHLRRALAHFPDQAVVERVMGRFYFPEGRAEGQPYLPVPNITLKMTRGSRDLCVLGAFAEVWLAKEGHSGLIGINLLEKIQLAILPALYGSMLAGIDYVLVGAGIPAKIPRLLDQLAEHQAVELEISVDGATQSYAQKLDPAEILPGDKPQLRRPKFLAIISAHVLATYLAREEATRPDGFVIEGHIAGGHNAPPRGKMQLTDDGEPVYGTRDDADLSKIAAIGLPFWLAGGYATPEHVQQAIAQGAAGVQVGTIFALSKDSGLTDELRGKMLVDLAEDRIEVRTDPLASPTGFPFKVYERPGTMGHADVYAARQRICDLGYLRTAYESKPGTVGYRCPAEPEEDYVRKGGEVTDTVGRKCLCNGLTASIALQQIHFGKLEAPLLTLGSDLSAAKELLRRHPNGWTAAHALDYLLGRTAPVQESRIPAGASV